MEIHIGSNTFRNTNGVLRVAGKDQMTLEVGHDGQLLLTADIYNERGEHVGKLNRNSWVFYQSDRYAITTQPSSLTLQDTQHGTVYFAAEVVNPGTVKVYPCRFYTATGVPCDVSSTSLQIGGVTLSGNVVDSVGTVVSIG